MKFIVKTMLLALAAMLISPILWIAVRVHQPMELDVFGGHTYLDLEGWMKADYARAAQETNWDGIGESCYGSHIWLDHFVLMPTEFFAAFLALAPETFHRERFVDPDWIEQGLVTPDNISLVEFMPAFWRAYENHLWFTMQGLRFNDPVLGCRLSRAAFEAWAEGEVMPP